LCPADLLVDLATFEGCSGDSYVLAAVPSELDTCPDDTWVDVVNLSSIGACHGVSIRAGVEGQAGLDAAACAAHAGSLEVFDPAFQTLFAGGGLGFWDTSVPGGTCAFPSAHAIPDTSIDAGLGAVRLRVSATKDTLGTAVPWPVELSVVQLPPVL
jgi:hypothetical protein